MATSSIDEVLRELDRVIDRAHAEEDRIGFFAVLYRKVTAKVKEGVEEGFFDDNPRMERLDCLFADLYLDAVAAHQGGRAPSTSWALTFEAGSQRRPLILQHLLVGINAHINLDLGVAAVRCSPGDELSGLRHDYDLVNAVLASMIATVQQDLLAVSPWMAMLDRLGARTQTEVVRFSIKTARAGAWKFATRLAGTPDASLDDTIATRDRAVAKVGRRVLHPGTLMSTGLLAVRAREHADVRETIELLRGASEPSLEEVAAVADDLTVDG